MVFLMFVGVKLTLLGLYCGWLTVTRQDDAGRLTLILLGLGIGLCWFAGPSNWRAQDKLFSALHRSR